VLSSSRTGSAAMSRSLQACASAPGARAVPLVETRDASVARHANTNAHPGSHPGEVLNVP